MDRVVVWPQPRKSTISLFKCKTYNIRFCGSTLYIHNDSSVTRWQWYVQEEERSNYLKNYFELGHRISGSILTREALAMIVFESFVSFSLAAESATKLRISADKNFKVHIYIWERERERERLLFKCTIVVVVEFLSFVVNDILCHARWLWCPDIHLLPFSRGRGIGCPFFGSICGQRCRNFPRFLRPTKPWASSPGTKKDARDLRFLNSGHSISRILKRMNEVRTLEL